MGRMAMDKGSVSSGFNDKGGRVVSPKWDIVVTIISRGGRDRRRKEGRK